MHVGQRMRQRREDLGISQGRLGRHLGLTFNQIQKYEKGANRIGAGRLFQIAKYLGVPPSYFFEGIDENEAHAAVAVPGAPPEPGEEEDLLGAFRAIPDAATRASVLALARSLMRA